MSILGATGIAFELPLCAAPVLQRLVFGSFWGKCRVLASSSVNYNCHCASEVVSQVFVSSGWHTHSHLIRRNMHGWCKRAHSLSSVLFCWPWLGCAPPSPRGLSVFSGLSGGMWTCSARLTLLCSSFLGILCTFYLRCTSLCTLKRLRRIEKSNWCRGANWSGVFILLWFPSFLKDSHLSLLLCEVIV